MKKEAGISAEEIKDEYRKIKAMLGRVPSQKEWRKYGRFSVKVVRNRWGNWGNFVRLMGDEPYKFENPRTRIKPPVFTIPLYTEFPKVYGNIIICANDPHVPTTMWSCGMNSLKSQKDSGAESLSSQEIFLISSACTGRTYRGLT